MPDQIINESSDKTPKKTPPVSSARTERSAGVLFWLAALVCIFLMLLGTGTLSKLGFSAESQLPEIYGTALTLCLSCIGLGEINFKILGSIAGLLIITLVFYKIESSNYREGKK